MLKAENLFGRLGKSAPSDGVYTVIPTGHAYYNPDGKLIEYSDSEYETVFNWLGSLTDSEGNSFYPRFAMIMDYSNVYVETTEHYAEYMYLPQNYSNRTVFDSSEEFFAFVNYKKETVLNGIYPTALSFYNDETVYIEQIYSDNDLPRVQLTLTEYNDLYYILIYIERIDTGKVYKLYQGGALDSWKNENEFYNNSEKDLFTNSDVGKEISLKIWWELLE